MFSLWGLVCKNIDIIITLILIREILINEFLCNFGALAFLYLWFDQSEHFIIIQDGSRSKLLFMKNICDWQDLEVVIFICH